MEFPPFIHCYAEFIGKKVSDFTPDDWRNAAINAAEILEKEWEHQNPPPKKRGRKPKLKPLNTLFAPNKQDVKKKTRGRPRQIYGKKFPLNANDLVAVLSEILSPETKRQFPDAPAENAKAAAMLCASIGYPTGQVETLLRAVRRVRADTKKK